MAEVKKPGGEAVTQQCYAKATNQHGPVQLVAYFCVLLYRSNITTYRCCGNFAEIPYRTRVRYVATHSIPKKTVVAHGLGSG